MQQADYDDFFDPEGGKTYAVAAQRSAAGWDVEVKELNLQFSVPSEPEVFSRAITLIARALRRPPFHITVSVHLAQ